GHQAVARVELDAGRLEAVVLGLLIAAAAGRELSGGHADEPRHAARRVSLHVDLLGYDQHVTGLEALAAEVDHEVVALDRLAVLREAAPPDDPHEPVGEVELDVICREDVIVDRHREAVADEDVELHLLTTGQRHRPDLEAAVRVVRRVDDDARGSGPTGEEQHSAEGGRARSQRAGGQRHHRLQARASRTAPPATYSATGVQAAIHGTSVPWAPSSLVTLQVA